jgi:hypothetical protein
MCIAAEATCPGFSGRRRRTVAQFASTDDDVAIFIQTLADVSARVAALHKLNPWTKFLRDEQLEDDPV